MGTFLKCCVPVNIFLSRPVYCRAILVLFGILISPSFVNAAIFNDDSRQDPICINETAARKARTVAIVDTGSGNCSAFLISPQNHVLTAAHCISDPPWSTNPSFTFNNQARSCNSTTTTTPVVVVVDESNLLRINRDLDYALFQLPVDVAISEGVGWLDLDPNTRLTQLQDEDALLYIVGQNPDIDRLNISLDLDCRITSVPTDCKVAQETGFNPPGNACLEHECDTVEGVSGSPVFTTSNNLVVGLHSGSVYEECIPFCSRDRNYSVKSRNIFPDISSFLPANMHADADTDGIPDITDNCPSTANSGQCTAG